MNMDLLKYIILDFGKVIADTSTGHWFITPNFYSIIGQEKINLDEFNRILTQYDHIISSQMKDEKEEYQAFTSLYNHIAQELPEIKNPEGIGEKIAYDFVFNDQRVNLYQDTKESLKKLAEQYPLILLSDNWPSASRIMKNLGTECYFSQIYISSIYHVQKKQGVFFDYPINDFQINPQEALFVDDNPTLLPIAQKKQLIPILMDRENDYVGKTKYKRVTSLTDLVNWLKI